MTVAEEHEEHMDNDNLKDYLREMDFHSFAKVNKSLLITILIKQGMYVGAYDLLCEYGYEEIDPRDLLRLCSRMSCFCWLTIYSGRIPMMRWSLNI